MSVPVQHARHIVFTYTYIYYMCVCMYMMLHQKLLVTSKDRFSELALLQCCHSRVHQKAALMWLITIQLTEI